MSPLWKNLLLLANITLGATGFCLGAEWTVKVGAGYSDPLYLASRILFSLPMFFFGVLFLLGPSFAIRWFRGTILTAYTERLEPTAIIRFQFAAIGLASSIFAGLTLCSIALSMITGCYDSLNCN